MKKYIYARESFFPLIVFLVPIFILLFMLSPFVMFEPFNYIFIIFFAIMFFVVLPIVLFNVIKWRMWHRKIKKYGVKTTGVVYKIFFQVVPPSQREPGYNKCYLKVRYIDPETKEEKFFCTPFLSIKPQKRDDITCNVYLYNGDILADDFQNLTYQFF